MYLTKETQHIIKRVRKINTVRYLVRYGTWYGAGIRDNIYYPLIPLKENKGNNSLNSYKFGNKISAHS